MSQMKAYIGAKIIRANKMGRNRFLMEIKGEEGHKTEGESGYLVQNPDGYVSWSPKKAFEESHREVSGEEKLMIHRDEG